MLCMNGFFRLIFLKKFQLPISNQTGNASLTYVAQFFLLILSVRQFFYCFELVLERLKARNLQLAKYRSTINYDPCILVNSTSINYPVRRIANTSNSKQAAHGMKKCFSLVNRCYLLLSSSDAFFLNILSYHNYLCLLLGQPYLNY